VNKATRRRLERHNAKKLTWPEAAKGQPVTIGRSAASAKHLLQVC
jgi:hypothetical protein